MYAGSSYYMALTLRDFLSEKLEPINRTRSREDVRNAKPDEVGEADDADLVGELHDLIARNVMAG